MLRSPILALALSTALAIGLGGALAAPAMASPPSSHTLVVDDDGAQCGPHAYSSIQAAVDAAHRGDRVRICPGRYAERVVVNKPLTLTGQPAAVAALDCFTEQTSEPDDLDTTVVPVLEPPDAEETPVLRLTADRIEVAGLVIQGVYDEDPDMVDGYQLIDAGLTTDDAHAGWRIHHNLFRLNFLAVELGSKGGPESRFDHNCLRDNYYSVANQRYTLPRALLDHNATYRSEATAWEIGWGYRGTTAVTLEHNTSRLDHLAVYAENDDHLTVRGNAVEQAGIGIHAENDDHLTIQGNLVEQAGIAIQAENDDHLTIQGNLVEQAGIAIEAKDDDHLTIQSNRVEQAGSGIYLNGALTQPKILHNTVTDSLGVAIIVNPPAGEAPVTGLVVRGNTVTDNGGSGLTTNAVANLTGASIVANTFSRNGRHGIQLNSGSRANRVLDNVTEGNAQYGIRLWPGTQDNLLVRNRMLGNGQADAVDETAVTTAGVTVLANRWVRNTCTVDVPTGEIC